MRSRRSLLSGAALAAAVVALGATSLISTAAQAATPPGLHISGTQLVEKDGTPFVMRGVNHAHTWFTNQTGLVRRRSRRCRRQHRTRGRCSAATGGRERRRRRRQRHLAVQGEQADLRAGGPRHHRATARERRGHARQGGQLLDRASSARLVGPGGLRQHQHRQRAVRQQPTPRQWTAATIRGDPEDAQQRLRSTPSWSTRPSGVRTGRASCATTPRPC